VEEAMKEKIWIQQLTKGALIAGISLMFLGCDISVP
jgi:hypothetical protein